ncbi:MAG: ribonuclease HII [Oscillospiraceae bacterium]|jgi:ribonuclease HII|nr:ribonuclease HII [Oscillospiraceae bacterium]MCR5173658.1 ribonuclease HII [Oscillospiraceae bacterium]
MKDEIDLLAMEMRLHEEGYRLICGVDEAGRGPLAGPVYAAAVILPENTVIDGLNDSKKLTEKKREELFDVIRDRALDFGIASASQQEIDDVNILNAVYLAMNRAVRQMRTAPDLLLIDGNRDKGIEGPSRCVVKGDATCACIAAASVLAKVSRDRFMYEMAERFPQYGFEKHKGYGTALHYEKLREFGPCELHRKSFLRKMH